MARSEDLYGEKLDRCLYNGLMKTIGGLAAGTVCSVFLFKRKPWPLIVGGSVGLGMAISSCQYEYKYNIPTIQPTVKHIESLLAYPASHVLPATSPQKPKYISTPVSNDSIYKSNGQEMAVPPQRHHNQMYRYSQDSNKPLYMGDPSDFDMPKYMNPNIQGQFSPYDRYRKTAKNCANVKSTEDENQADRDEDQIDEEELEEEEVDDAIDVENTSGSNIEKDL